MTTETPKLTAHTDLAYARWQAPDVHWTKQEFWDQLSADERVAVFTSNFIGHVFNGGFVQWNDNGYATDETIGFLKRLCDRLAHKSASEQIQELLEKFEVVRAEFEVANHGLYGEEEDYVYGKFSDACDKLDNAFYTDLGEKFLIDVETSL